MKRMTLEEMTDQAQDFLRDRSPEGQRIIHSELNQAYDQIASQREWRELIGFVNESFTFTAGANYLALPEDAAEIISLSNKGSDYELRRIELSHLLRDNIYQIDTAGSLVLTYADLGYRATCRPLSQDDEVTVVTESVNDKSVPVRVRGMRGTPEIEDVDSIKTDSSNPNTVTKAGAFDFREGWSIQSISVDRPLDGFIKVREQQSGDILAYVTKQHRESQYLILQFASTPSAAESLAVAYKKRVSPLQKSDDLTAIAAGEAIVEMAISKMRQRREQYQQAREHKRTSEELLTAAFTAQQGHQRTIQQARPDRRGRARLRGF